VLRHLTSKVLHAVLETTLLTQFDYVTELQLLHSGSTLVSQGEDCRRLYTVLHGRLRAFQGGGHGGDSGTAEVVGAGTVGGVRAESGSSGRGTLFAEFSRGRVVGIVEVAIQQPWQCTLVAARDSRIFQVTTGSSIVLYCTIHRITHVWGFVVPVLVVRAAAGIRPLRGERMATFFRWTHDSTHGSTHDIMHMRYTHSATHMALLTVLHT